ncbi:DNA cytosine methyltransferase [Actinotignum sp. GS-2025e]|uniref:DNA cytosine methyltransferase n=1 Tax=Actinotignum sp. GS-2025e TaxID=3427278 RepID=UPI003F4717A1
MSALRLGSLFDGAGGFPLAATQVGITPVWASEIEPLPILVTTTRFPCMTHLGDVQMINGASVEPVDVVTFGSPCQDLSVAGTRMGLSGERSSLFFQAARIIDEMRQATNGRFPRFAVWENVPGAFSSRSGADFHVVLKALIGLADPQAAADLPCPSRWQPAGAVVGDGWSLAWRVLDAQYFGVPQRRRRIFLVCDFAGDGAPEILFEPTSCSRDLEAGSQETQDHATTPTRSTHPNGERLVFGLNTIHQSRRAGGHFGYAARVSKTLDLKGGEPTCNQGGMVILEPGQKVFSASKSDFFTRASTNQAGALLASDYTDPPLVASARLRPRRLTPLECARLQGFPDTWTDNLAITEPAVEQLDYWQGVWDHWNKTRGVRMRASSQVTRWLADPVSDTGLYKLWGNSVAVPVVRYVLERLKNCVETTG